MQFSRTTHSAHCGIDTIQVIWTNCRIHRSTGGVTLEKQNLKMMQWISLKSFERSSDLFTNKLILEAKVCKVQNWNKKYWTRLVSQIITEKFRKWSSQSLKFLSWNFWLVKKVANTVLSVCPSSSCLCEILFSVINFVRSLVGTGKSKRYSSP
jgi:hypothetical protein